MCVCVYIYIYTVYSIVLNCFYMILQGTYNIAIVPDLVVPWYWKHNPEIILQTHPKSNGSITLTKKLGSAVVLFFVRELCVLPKFLNFKYHGILQTTVVFVSDNWYHHSAVCKVMSKNHGGFCCKVFLDILLCKKGDMDICHSNIKEIFKHTAVLRVNIIPQCAVCNK